MKRIIKQASLVILAIAMFCQCQPKQEGSHAKIVKVNGNKVIDCNVSEITDTIDLPLSKIVKNCSVIPLETNAESLFKRVYHLSVSKSYIAVHSRGQMPIKLFSRQGKFIRDIGKIGRGPGEFTSLYDIQLDEEANRIYLSPFARANKLIVYSLDSENLPDIPLVYQQTKFKANVQDDVVTILSMPFKMKEGKCIPVAYQQTTKGKLIKEVETPEHLEINPRNSKGQFIGFNNEISSTHNADAFDSYTMTWGKAGYDTLYHYNTSKNQMIPKFVATFSEKKQGSWAYEWKSHYWAFVFGEKYRGSKILVDKKTLKSDFFHLKNDFYGGIEMNSIYVSNNQMFICPMTAMNFKEQCKEVLKDKDLDSAIREKLERINKSLKEDDNDVLFIGEMI
ncbi:6-bladed beta-propeller [Puteibacter caeruleilacunae]|nr:6-bladed beta-propeller [Puteibacter caeruleilacunae]